ncbi:3-hydroxyanthranilate 3,4-dioxygenase isoform X1 [Acipenser ruthenus]|uniref:3-hydroxyanthranilate 3,4-dioxygenase isoform X1 n=1 Tax=Acipenser ruthenus TaxID=7906 RepID=UPI00145B3019|nr:3-hydroxyanthranilate 3,4-dioxygenase isoform X1 [Acipenser ruthenus]XP_058880705.1 3-hydroxyanthranilate 3,4-dioxygenase isoform X1 [Acipenser ruthenus]
MGPLMVNVDKWIEENEASFLPPVCNKLMHFSQLNVMFVGGPNMRNDYHIEEGEELFYQLRGDMCLKVIENNTQKDVLIREGEMFLLPARIPHSPQRQAGTVGLVIERQRLQSETDGLRYYVDNSTAVLFERWFYCENLGVQLAPIISEFFSSEQYRTGKPNPEELLKQTPFPFNSTHVMTPFCFKEWIDKHRQELSRRPSLDMFGVQFETETMLYGDGESEGCKPYADIWIWQLEGTSRVTLGEESVTLSAGDSYLIPGQNKYQWKRSEGCIALYVVQDPERKRPHS